MRKVYVSYLCLAVIIISFCLEFGWLMLLQLQLTLAEKMLFIFLQTLAIIGYYHFAVQNGDEERKKVNYFNMHVALFLLYCFYLIYILFLDPDFGRNTVKEFLTFQEYVRNNVNLTPFATVQLFIDGYRVGHVTFETIVRNLIGNLVVFMPMAYFLPVLFKKQRHFFVFLLSIIMIVFCVELLQVCLRLGSGDIDDLLLNISGALMMYGLLRCVFMKRMDWLSE